MKTNKQMINSLTKIPIYILAIAMLIFLTACSDVEPVVQTETAHPAAVASSSNNEQIKTIPLDLKSSPIDKMVFLGLKASEVTEADPCPYLTDEAAVAAVKTNFELKRRRTSKDECYWSKNLGFSIKLTIEPLVTAKPIRERMYNLESPPIIKNWSEPGKNAVVLYDTTWDKERAYAMSFEQDNKLVMIFVTGMYTDSKRLITAANEVSSKLLLSPKTDSQQNNTIAINLCSTWNKSEIEAIIGAPVILAGSNDNCKWETGINENLKQISVGIFYGKNYPWKIIISGGANEIPALGERSVMIKQRKKGGNPGSVLLNTLYNERLITVSVSDTIDNHKAIALALSKNIDKRF